MMVLSKVDQMAYYLVELKGCLMAVQMVYYLVGMMVLSKVDQMVLSKVDQMVYLLV